MYTYHIIYIYIYIHIHIHIYIYMRLQTQTYGVWRIALDIKPPIYLTRMCSFNLCRMCSLMANSTEYQSIYLFMYLTRMCSLTLCRMSSLTGMTCVFVCMMCVYIYMNEGLGVCLCVYIHVKWDFCVCVCVYIYIIWRRKFLCVLCLRARALGWNVLSYLV